MTSQEMHKVAKIIAIARKNPTCKECVLDSWCPFSYDCLSNNYKDFKKNEKNT